MNAAAVAGVARVFIEKQMTSTCTVRAKAIGRVVDPETGEVVPTPGAVVYSGKCRVKPGSNAGNATVGAGGAEIFTYDYVVSLPFAATGVEAGHRVTVDTSPDPDLVGVEVEVHKPDRGEHITARRLYCNEVS